MVLGRVSALSHRTPFWASEELAPCPAAREEHPHETTRGRWVLKDGQCVQQESRAGGSEGQRCWGMGVLSLTERKQTPEHVVFALETESQARGP